MRRSSVTLYRRQHKLPGANHDPQRSRREGMLSFTRDYQNQYIDLLAGGTLPMLARVKSRSGRIEHVSFGFSCKAGLKKDVVGDGRT